MLALLFALQSADPPTYSGLAKQLVVAIPRVAAGARVDGALDEPVWRRAARLAGFSQYRPVDGRPAEDSTEVLVWYAPDAIYFGIYTFELFFFNDTATTEIYTLSLHDALPISPASEGAGHVVVRCVHALKSSARSEEHTSELQSHVNLVCRLLLEKKKKII